MAITPDGQTAYVTNAVSDSVTVIENADSSAPSVASTIPDIQSRPIAVAVDPVHVNDLNDPQTVTFTTTPPPSMYPGGANFVTSASSSSGLPVVLSIDPSATDVCEIDGSNVSPLSVGTCVIDANQPGDLEYAPSPQVQQTISVTTEQPQTVSFGSPGPGTTAVGGRSYSPTATASSGLLASISLDPSSTGCTLNEGAVSSPRSGSASSTPTSRAMHSTPRRQRFRNRSMSLVMHRPLRSTRRRLRLQQSEVPAIPPPPPHRQGYRSRSVWLPGLRAAFSARG